MTLCGLFQLRSATQEADGGSGCREERQIHIDRQRSVLVNMCVCVCVCVLHSHIICFYDSGSIAGSHCFEWLPDAPLVSAVKYTCTGSAAILP